MDRRHCIFVPCSCAAVDNVAQISLRPTSLRFSQNDWAKMEQLKPSCLLLGLPVILLRISVGSATLDALAARGMRLTSVTQEGCNSFDPLPYVAGDCSS